MRLTCWLAMGLALTICYLLLAYLSPAVLVPSLAPYHIQVVLAALALFASLPGLFRSGITRQPSLYCLMIFFSMVGISSAANGGVHAGFIAVEEFASSCIVFILIIADCGTLRRVKVVAAVVVAVTLYFVLRGAEAYWHDSPLSSSPFVLHQGPGETYIPRIRGLGFVNDPNDFAQLIVCCIPLLWLWRRPNHKLSNLVTVYLPLLALLAGAYLTHSRGGLMALGVLLVFSLRKRFGTTLSLIATSILTIAMIALNFTGGRDISEATGSDRMDAWSAGLQLARASPLLGVGYGRFPDHYPITAHNSFVLCMAEIGFIGYFSWIGLIVTAFVGAWAILHNRDKTGYAVEICKYKGNSTALDQRTGWLSSPDAVAKEPVEEVRRCLRLTMASLLGFLTAAWFLSRAYTTPLYTILGIANAITLLAMRQDNGLKFPVASLIVRYTLGFGVLIIALIYGILRLH